MKSNHHPAKQSSGRAARLVRFLRERKGVSALEYAILVGVIAVGIGAALTLFEAQISAALANAGASIATIKGLAP